jgi:hypothetical protein
MVVTQFAQPNWADITDDLCCPLCDYNLRGLTHPQCPECGYRFEWPELLDPTRRAHPYLFEHHPARNFWSLKQTLIGGLHPAVFWRNVHPTQPSRPRRIRLYAILTSAPLLITWIGYAIAMTSLEFARYFQWMRGANTQGIPHFSLRRAEVIFSYAMRSDALLGWGLACVLWPWLTLAGLMIFRWSMKRANVKRVHVFRCVVYSADLSLFVWPIFVWLMSESFELDPFLGLWPSTIARIWASVAVVWLVLFSYRLICAYRFYLRFDHVVATVLAVQAITALAVFKVLFVLQGY